MPKKKKKDDELLCISAMSLSSTKKDNPMSLHFIVNRYERRDGSKHLIPVDFELKLTGENAKKKLIDVFYEIEEFSKSKKYDREELIPYILTLMISAHKKHHENLELAFNVVPTIDNGKIWDKISKRIGVE